MNRRRPRWPELPRELRAAIQERAGARVVGWSGHDDGYSPGPALTLELADGSSIFVKGADAEVNAESVRLLRRESAVVPLLPPSVPAPRWHWHAVEGTWEVAAFDVVAGRRPGPGPDDVAALGRLVTMLAATTAPAGVTGLASDFDFVGWRSIGADPHLTTRLHADAPWAAAELDRLITIESGWAEAARGDVLVHHDLRSDNVLVRPDGEAVALDWPHAVRGSAVLDLIGWLPSLRVEGGPEPATIFDEHPVGRAADRDAATTVLTAIAGYFVHSAYLPPVPAIAHLRPFQRAQGEVALRWLRQRLGPARP